MRKMLGITIIAAVAAVGLMSTIMAMGMNKEQSVLAATVEMERLAIRLDHAKKIAPETKLEIVRLSSHPWSDCAQVACRTSLDARNRAARERLQAVLAGSNSPTELSAKAEQKH